MKKCIALVLTLALCLLCSACAQKVQAQNLMEGVRGTNPQITQIPEEAVSALYDLSFSLFSQLEDKGENTVFSPVSVFYCLGLIANGSGGNTLAQLENLLGMDVQTLNEVSLALSERLESSQEVSWNVANSIWFKDRGLTVQPDFLQKNADYYDAKAYAAPFDDSTVRDINTWCSQQTKGMIPKILDEIPGDAQMYLINALCFEGQWATQYEKKDIWTGTFYNADGTRTETDMLHSQEGIYLETDMLTGFAKAYKGYDYSFVGLLPKEGVTIQQLVQSLTREVWASLTSSSGDGRNRIYHPVNVTMPEFAAKTSTPLKKILQQMGVTDLFEGGLADLEPMASCVDGPLYCSRIQQEAFIQVDRSGTKAAAITFGENKAEAAMPQEPFSVILDRPYVYAIVDNATGLPMFLGVTYCVE